jgi:hypothetical protein
VLEEEAHVRGQRAKERQQDANLERHFEEFLREDGVGTAIRPIGLGASRLSQESGCSSFDGVPLPKDSYAFVTNRLKEPQ